MAVRAYGVTAFGKLQLLRPSRNHPTCELAHAKGDLRWRLGLPSSEGSNSLARSPLPACVFARAWHNLGCGLGLLSSGGPNSPAHSPLLACAPERAPGATSGGKWGFQILEVLTPLRIHPYPHAPSCTHLRRPRVRVGAFRTWKPNPHSKLPLPEVALGASAGAHAGRGECAGELEPQELRSLILHLRSFPPEVALDARGGVCG